MSSTHLTFDSRQAHRAHLVAHAALPRGFRVGTTRFSFIPAEAPKPANMTLTLIALHRPTTAFGAVFTRNAFPGAPVIIGRQRLHEATLAAVIINNKISNVCAPDGVANAERVCAAVAQQLGCKAAEVLPSSTGVIGWRQPIESMLAALPDAVAGLSAESALPAAEGIMTTDLYPKVRAVSVAGGRIVGIAKGAGMIEPDMATMLVYLLTDLVVPRDHLRAMLARVADATFNRISVDGDTSTSDTVAMLSSGLQPCPDLGAFEFALSQLCGDLAEDVVRNGEGVRHVIRATVRGAPDEALARGAARAIVNSPLFKSAIAGNDPNVGRLVAAVGKYLGARATGLDLSRTRILLGGRVILDGGIFRLDHATEDALVAYLASTELYASVPGADGTFKPPIDYPPHERAVELVVDLGVGAAESTVVGADLTHEYVSENADYRS